MIVIVLVLFLFLLYNSVCLRLAVFHPVSVVRYAFKDAYRFIRHKKWRLCTSAELICFTGLFGRGKTLTSVHRIVSSFDRYHDRMVWDKERKKWVTQKVLVLSNVHFRTVPYEYLTHLSQIVTFCEEQKKKDSENDTLTICFVLIDEASTQLNSRSFKENIDYDFLNKLLTCRHYHICGIYTTSQRFKLEDKLLRDVTQTVEDCRKLWRFQTVCIYDAYELENAGSPSLVRPLRKKGFFVTDDCYGSYDTLACVENLTKSCRKGDLLTDAEILSRRYSPDSAGMEHVDRPSRRYMRRQKRMH